MMIYALSLAAFASSLLRTLLLGWLLRTNARFVRRRWSSLTEPTNVRIQVFVLCNLMYVGTWFLHSTTLMMEVIFENFTTTLLLGSVSMVILCYVISGVSVIATSVHLALCTELVLARMVRFFFKKLDCEKMNNLQKKLVLVWIMMAVPVCSVVIGRIQALSTNLKSGDWEYAELVHGEDPTSNVSFGIELVVCTAKTKGSLKRNVTVIAGEFAAVLFLTTVCLLLRIFYDFVSKKSNCSGENVSNGWQYLPCQRTPHPLRWLAVCLPLVTTLWLCILLPLHLLHLRPTDASGGVYPETGVHVVLMMSVILVTTTQDASQHKKTSLEENLQV